MVRVSDADASPRRTAIVVGGVVGIVFTFIGFLLALLWELDGIALLACVIGTGVVAGGVVGLLSMRVMEGAGAAFLALVQPSGASTPYEAEFSAIQAMEARDDFVGALAAYDEAMTRTPDHAALRLRAADCHARHGDPRRAEALFLEARRLTSDRGIELYATQRVVDLRLGVLDEPARALPELRRIADRFAGTREGEGARTALERLRKELASRGDADA